MPLTTLSDIAEDIREKRRTSADAVESCVNRYRLFQPVTNAFLDFRGERAAAHAREIDASDASGNDQPLRGVPIAFKDMFDYPGHRATFGSRLPQREPASAPAHAIAALERAGAINLGFLNMAEFALGATGHNAAFGHCRNPWNPAFMTGGSSSGAAAAVASGMAFGAIGSDTGGSIRIPAACCGVVGLKPGQGRIDNAGAMPLSRSMDCIGPIARTAQDCAILFEALLGERPADAVTAWRLQPPPPASIRLAFPSFAVEALVDPEIGDALGRAVECLAGLGVTIVEASEPDIDPLHCAADLIQRVEAYAFHAAGLSATPELYTRHIAGRMEGGDRVFAVDYLTTLRRRDDLKQSVLETVFADCDALILPVIGQPVPGIEQSDEAASASPLALIARITRWTRWVNYLGLPALSVPCGFDRRGLPIGMQLVGRPQGERRLLEIAHLFQLNSAHHSNDPAKPPASAAARTPPPEKTSTS